MQACTCSVNLFCVRANAAEESFIFQLLKNQGSPLSSSFEHKSCIYLFIHIKICFPFYCSSQCITQVEIVKRSVLITKKLLISQLLSSIVSAGFEPVTDVSSISGHGSLIP